MARPLGTPKTGGRKKGTPNKQTLWLQDQLESQSIDVASKIFEIFPMLAPEKQVDVLLNLLPYLYPKRKPIEMDVPSDAEDGIIFVTTEP